MFELCLNVAPGPAGLALAFTDDSGALLRAEFPVTVETIGPDGREGRVRVGYADVDRVSDTELIATAEVSGRYAVRDRWIRLDDGRWRVDRGLEVREAAAGAGVRLLLELTAEWDAFEDFRYFAPGAMYDLNDLNGDYVDDYSDTQTLFYREDRLSAMSVLAHHAGRRVALSLSRADVPEFDTLLDREPGQTSFRQRTDVGSLGIAPVAEGGCLLAAAYPFVERDRCHALLVGERPAWGAYWPATPGTALELSYLVGAVAAATPHDALWTLWRDRLEDLKPRTVELEASLDEITTHRLDALLAYYREDPDGTAAGFVTNCHPQDGLQLGDVIQYGFTGQNVLNAYNLLRAGDVDDERRRRALRVIDFYVEDARRNPDGLVHALYKMDLGQYASWWTGLLLPLAYAQPGDDLERLMGPLYEHLAPVIAALRGREGTYLRCLAEEYDALVQAYERESASGVTHPEWRAAAESFGRFLLRTQQPDGTWYRAYSLDGAPLTDPDVWFGQTDVQRKSSTATVVPLLLRLHRLIGGDEWLAAAERACDYVNTAFVEGLKFNGGIHDSMYAKPQLVDHESIVFAFRALLETHRATGEQRYLAQAIRAAWVVCSWAWLWDVPLPPESTFARFGFRTTGWTGCDAPGAGYIHPMGVIVVPDLVEVARLSGDDTFLRMAELILAACNENVALPGKDWGYARPGLQEEGLQVSWCWIDDPMFTGTEFGGRGKGEGNKTCFPWISAVTVWAHQELLARYGTAKVAGL
jgi:hypothetical protein